MKSKSVKYIPLIVTVGQVAIFPYYIVWLKEVALTFTLFSWLFAGFSFAAAWGYRVYQVKKIKTHSYIPIIYIGMGFVYIFVACLHYSVEYLPYVALLLQVLLGFLQGYFRAWHIEQKNYHLHAVHHYLMVGVIMLGFSFIKIVSPAALITTFGGLLCICGVLEMSRKRNK